MVAIDFTRKIVLICGSSYAGEMKKSVFTTLNFYLPAQNVDADALLGQRQPPAATARLFFGLSGTGKTTLSADPNRTLIGDDETRLGSGRHLQFRRRLLRQDHQALARSRADDLGRHQPLRRGAGERVVFDPVTRVPDYDDGSKTENTRSAYPLDFIPNAVAHRPRRASEEHHLPHRRCLWRDAADRQAHAGAGDVSLPVGLHRQGRRHREGSGRRAAGILDLLRRAVPAARIRRSMANLLRDYITKHKVDCLAGQFRLDRRHHTASAVACRSRRRARWSPARSTARSRMPTSAPIPISVSRCRRRCPGVEPHLLNPFKTWKDKAEFDETARELVAMFQKNFAKFEQHVDAGHQGGGTGSAHRGRVIGAAMLTDAAPTPYHP